MLLESPPLLLLEYDPSENDPVRSPSAAVGATATAAYSSERRLGAAAPNI